MSLSSNELGRWLSTIFSQRYQQWHELASVVTVIATTSHTLKEYLYQQVDGAHFMTHTGHTRIRTEENHSVRAEF